MKKLIFLFASLALVALAACDDKDGRQAEKPPVEEPPVEEPPVEEPEEPKVVGTLPVADADIPDEVTAFFKKHLPRYSFSYSDLEFNSGKIDFNETECFMINSVEEFKAVAPPSAELPAIDFEKHTLIIGQNWMGDPGYTLEKQAVDTESEEMTLSLVYKRLEGATPGVVTIFYFWGLYPKLPEKPLNVDISIIKN